LGENPNPNPIPNPSPSPSPSPVRLGPKAQVTEFQKAQRKARLRVPALAR